MGSTDLSLDPAPVEAAAGPRPALVQSLQRGLSVLDAVAASSVPLTCKDIAQQLGLDRTITYRLLKTLEVERLVECKASCYQLTARNVLLGNAFREQQNLRRVALPYMLNLLHHALARHPIATMALYVPVDAFVTVVEQIWPSDTQIDLILQVSSRLPIDESAAGRCILSQLPVPEVKRLIGEARFAPLEERLDLIRAAGGVDHSHNESSDVTVFSALIRDRAGQAVGAISVSGRRLEEQLSRSSDVAVQIRRAADQIGMAFR